MRTTWRRSRRRRSNRTTLAATGLILVAGAGVGWWYLRSESQSEQRSAAELFARSAARPVDSVAAKGATDTDPPSVPLASDHDEARAREARAQWAGSLTLPPVPAPVQLAADEVLTPVATVRKPPPTGTVVPLAGRAERVLGETAANDAVGASIRVVWVCPRTALLLSQSAAVSFQSTPPAGAGGEPVAANPARSYAGHPAIDAARRRYDSGQAIEARHELNALLNGSLDPANQELTRQLLARIANDTIFSRAVLPADPLIATHVVAPGEVLTKIAAQYRVPYDIILTINGLSDARRLRAEQKLKIPRGPFHARVSMSAFRMDLYLGDLYVRSYPVGIGADAGTPIGTWRVKNRLKNPTYFPPASAKDKRIIAADDPRNPLGEHWIGLEGSDGDAVGKEGFGIHGTVEPDAIGKAVSMGCIRLHNADVEFVYSLLAEGHSTVITGP